MLVNECDWELLGKLDRYATNASISAAAATAVTLLLWLLMVARAIGMSAVSLKMATWFPSLVHCTEGRPSSASATASDVVMCRKG